MSFLKPNMNINVRQIWNAKAVQGGSGPLWMLEILNAYLLSYEMSLHKFPAMVFYKKEKAFLSTLAKSPCGPWCAFLGTMQRMALSDPNYKNV